MAVQKNFAVKNGFEVSGDLIYADANQNKVGIATTNLTHTLTVKGDVSANNVDVLNDLSINGTLSIGNSVGASGQFLISTGIGVTWSQLPGLRTTQTYTATEAQSTFNFSYNPSVGVDVYINGIKIPSTEYTATNGTSIILNDPCFDQDTVDLVAYSVSALAIGNTGITGLTIQDEGVSVGNAGNIVSLNFVGAGVTSTLSGFGVTVYVNGVGSGSTNYWAKTAAGINTLSKVGIGTTNPRFTLEVGSVGASGTSLYVNGNTRIVGILTIGTSSITLDGTDNQINVGTGVTIHHTNGVQVGDNIVHSSGLTLNNINVSGVSTFIGNVGVGTTNATSKLTVRDGDISVGVSTAHGVILTSPNGTQYRLIVDDLGTLSTVTV